MRFPRASGILLHPTSLPGPHGSGDFGPAAYHFVDWLVSAGQTLWQMLPLGGIGPGNSPYMSTSAFAGNALLIDIDELAAHGWLKKDELVPDAGFEAGRLNFAAAHGWRMHKLQLAAQRFAEHASAADRASFDAFCRQHDAWLHDYALFMSLSEHTHWRDWCDWQPALAKREAAALKAAAQQHATRVAFWKFCQWRFFEQWFKLKKYANDRGVQIVGDAPIFIAYSSAEVWSNQHLFELDASGRPTVVAGVPPDYFSKTGQRWGNPLYRWDEHAKQGYAWWVERVRFTFELVDIVRIDHFRGFAGYWEIPASEPTAIKGQWLPGPGDGLFKAIAKALGPMPIIAEDLGEITPDVDALRRKFAFPGMRILQFAWAGDSTDRFLPHNYEHDTVVYTGTHDNDTTAGWWHAATDHEKHHLRHYLATDGHDIAWTLIRAACASVADTAIYPMQDVLSLPTEHRMNFPGKESGYWEWRFTWDEVKPQHAQRLKEMVTLYGRGPQSAAR
jgi:4-alpha-glucanotransferase